MKNVFIAIFSIVLASSVQASADLVVTTAGQEAQSVVDSLNYPQNLSARMLKAAIDDAKATSLAIEGLSITKLDKDRYQLSFSLDNEESSEIAEVNVSEVLVSDGKAYVFGFSVERVAKMNKHPGVSLGNN